MERVPAFVALDLETTGLDFEKDEIIEVALVRFENGEPKENLDFLVKPSAAELRPFIETLTGISETDLAEAPDDSRTQCRFRFQIPQADFCQGRDFLRYPRVLGFAHAFAHCFPGCSEPPPRYARAGTRN